MHPFVIKALIFVGLNGLPQSKGMPEHGFISDRWLFTRRSCLTMMRHTAVCVN